MRAAERRKAEQIRCLYSFSVSSQKKYGGKMEYF